MKRLFTLLAPVYDRLNHVFSLGRDIVWRKEAVKEVCGSRILDLACGTGDLTKLIRAHLPQAEVDGLDLTPAMLDVARQKVTGVNFREGNAEALGDLGLYDTVTCAFGFRNFRDKEKVWRELSRVTASGGRVVILEFFRQRGVLAAFTRFWLKLLTQLLIRRLKGEYNYLAASIDGTVSEEEFCAMSQRAGFTCCKRCFFFPCCTMQVFKRL